MRDHVYRAQAMRVKELEAELEHARAVLDLLGSSEDIEQTTPRHVALAHLAKSEDEMAQRRQDAADGIVRTADVPKRRTGRLDPTPEEPMSVDDLNASGFAPYSEAIVRSNLAMLDEEQRIETERAERRARAEVEADARIAEQQARQVILDKARRPWWKR